MNYANYIKMLIYNYLFYFPVITFQLFCIKLKHIEYEIGQFYFQNFGPRMPDIALIFLKLILYFC